MPEQGRPYSRTLTSAWIETGQETTMRRKAAVALSRVRGLKRQIGKIQHYLAGRTLTSAWIETLPDARAQAIGRVALSRVRGLKLEPFRIQRTLG